MADIDVTELMNDPDFVDSVSLIRRTQVLSKGENTLTEAAAVPTTMSVQPVTPRDMNLLPEGVKLSEAKLIFFKGTLNSFEADGYGDVIVHAGTRYTVQATDDYTEWGQGWQKGVAIREKVTYG